MFNNLEVLRLLKSLGATHSLTQTADALDISVSKASRLLQEARASFHDPLFLRTGTALTPSGFFLSARPEIEAVLKSIDALTDRSPFDPSHLERTFRVATLDAALELLLMPTVELCRRAAPKLKIDVVPLAGSSVTDLQEGGIDFLMFGTSDVTIHGNLHSLPLLAAPYELICRRDHPVAVKWREAGELSLEDLLRFDYLGFETPFPFTYLEDDADWLDRLEFGAVMKFPYFSVQAHWVLTTDALASIPLPLARRLKEELHQRLEIVPLPEGVTRYRWEPTIFWHGRLHTDPAAQWFRGMVATAAKQVAHQYGLEREARTTSTVNIVEVQKGRWQLH